MKLELFRKKDFSLLMFGKIVSLLGTQMQNFALSLYVLKITGSATKFASVLVVTLIPQLLLGPFAGVFVDWLDRKKILVYLDLVAGIVVGIYAVIYASKGGLSLGSIYILVILLSLISLLFQPAIGTVIPSIIEKEKLIDANGINSFLMSVGNLAAPALAGTLFGMYGLFVILVVNSISFILSSICEGLINIPKINKAPENISVKAFFTDFSEGVAFVKSKKLILTIIAIALVINFAADPVFSIGFAFMSKRILKISDFQYGTLESAFVIAMMIAPFFAIGVAKKFELGTLIFWDFVISSLLFAVLAIVPSPAYLSLFNRNFIPYLSIIIIVFIIGLVITTANIALGTIFQKEIPLEMMGRVGTLLSTISMGATPLGRILFGFLFDRLPAYLCILISAFILLSVTLLFRKSLCDKGQNLQEVAENISTEASV